MGEDKAFIEMNGTPLWRRQLQILQELAPRELFLSGPSREQWRHIDSIIISDAKPDAGPLAGLVAALRRCSTPLLLALAIDLPNMTADHLRELLARCSNAEGVIPRWRQRFEPLAAVYPRTALSLAENCLASDDHSLQRFAARCVSDRLLDVMDIAIDDEPLFLNMNTPEDLSSVAAVYDRRPSSSQRRDSAVIDRRYR